ncbi:MAG: hypothetical protein Q7S22_01880 [Candidatus Micrarchaeota archaeon]|nr:hypothetical protein [Candidatus Micrarchaeota archaeon]
MRIHCAPPVKTDKTQFFRGDEATVSRITGKGRYNGMVERLQDMNPYVESRFKAKDGKGLPILPVYSRDNEYHLLKFLAGLLTKRLFPDNFLSLRELRFFEEKGKFPVAVTYSDFVVDDTDAMKRATETSRLWYGADNDRTKLQIRSRADAYEHLLNPELSRLSDQFLAVGLDLAHPECNYHIAGGKTIFFEVEGLNLVITLKHLLTAFPGDFEALCYFAALYSIILKTKGSERDCREPNSYVNQKPVKQLIEDIYRILVIRDPLLIQLFFDAAMLVYRDVSSIDEKLTKIRKQHISMEAKTRLLTFLQDDVAPEIWDMLK